MPSDLTEVGEVFNASGAARLGRGVATAEEMSACKEGRGGIEGERDSAGLLFPTLGLSCCTVGLVDRLTGGGCDVVFNAEGEDIEIV